MDSGTVTQPVLRSERRLRKMLEHVSKRWIPVNSITLNKIKSGLSNNIYDENTTRLLEDLKSDVSLFSWCIKELAENNTDSDEEYFDPVARLCSLDIEEFKNLLHVREAEISSHSMDLGSDFQLHFLTEGLLGASAAEVLANDTDDRAYGASLLRTLGLSLLAWNYPTVISDIIENLDSEQDLELEIAKRLGYSPSLFATAVVRSWGIAERKCLSLGLRISENGAVESLSSNTTEELRNELQEFCEIGELLARTQNPTFSIQSSGAWQIIETGITSRAGASGLAKIREYFQKNYVAYAMRIPRIAKMKGRLFNTKNISPTSELSRVHDLNPNSKEAGLVIEVGLRELYDEILKGEKADKQHLQRLISLIESSGFSGGCIYTMDPGLAKLVPQLSFGHTQLEKVKAFDVYPRSELAVPTNKNLIIRAYQQSELQTDLRSLSNGRTYLAISGSFGKVSRMGVMYLEHPRFTGAGDKSHELLVTQFHALRQALVDCLFT